MQVSGLLNTHGARTGKPPAVPPPTLQPKRRWFRELGLNVGAATVQQPRDGGRRLFYPNDFMLGPFSPSIPGRAFAWRGYNCPAIGGPPVLQRLVIGAAYWSPCQQCRRLGGLGDTW